MNTKNTDNIYDITKYSDVELYNFLDVNNPTDRELEAKILLLIQKYSNIENDANVALSQFFQDIYGHFFELSVLDDDDMIEGLENMLVTDSSSNIAIPLTQSVQPDSLTIPSANIGYTQALNYTKGTVNPLLKESVKRIISIDSQYRDMVTYPLSTDFTFNLSDTLIDVVSLKLYSVQIPYTWYTINNNFGSNFFNINGNSPGINDGNHDYKITINSGNYIATDLINAVHNSIVKLKSTITDINLGTTDISFNVGNVKASVTLDITNTYNDNNYEVYFPTWTDPTDSTYETDRLNSIPGFLGFNHPTYKTYNIYSNISLYSTTNNNLNTKFNIDNSNNSFTIQIYTSNINEYYDISNQTIIQSIPITLTLPVGYTTKTIIMNNVISILHSNQFLTDASFVINPTSNITTISFNLNRLTIPYTSNMKACILFPNESTIWTGPGSCFNFDTSANQSYNELNNIIAETPILNDIYNVTDNTYIYLKCNKQNYGYVPSSSGQYRYIDNSGNTVKGSSDNSYNDYVIKIPPSNNYTYYAYVNALTTAFSQVDANFGQISYLLDANSHPNLSFNISNQIYTNQYKIQLPQALATILNFPVTLLDINSVTEETEPYTHKNGSNIFISRFENKVSGYTLSDLSINIISIGQSNKYVPTITINISNIENSSYSVSELSNAINSAFTKYTDANYGIIFANTNITLITDPYDNTMILCTLTMNINSTLTEQDYTAYFYNDGIILDISNLSLKSQPNTYGYYGDLPSNLQWLSPAHSWSYLNISAQYIPLSFNDTNGYDIITGNNPISSKTNFNLIDGSNNFFYIRPIYNATGGVYTTEFNATGDAYYNDIKITIPIPTISYSIQTFIIAINNILNDSNHPETAGSQISFITDSTGHQYTKIRLNINKIFTAKDYKIVFYNPETFTRATTGVIGKSNIQNVLWDSTLGWIMGFRNLTEYDMTPDNVTHNISTGQSYYAQSSLTPYTYNSNTNIAVLTGDTCVSVVLYSYFMIILDDYTQNRLNDGLVTIAAKDTDISLPSYSSKASYTIDPVTGKLVANSSLVGYNNLTTKQLYSANQILSAQQTKKSNYSAGPFVHDIFGFVPVKTAGMQNGQTYIEFGGSLQLQERSYFGPVNIHRLSVTLLNDKGETIDLNGANWSFALTCDQLYTTNSTTNK